MSNLMRRIIVRTLREEGRAAALAGKSRHSNPHLSPGGNPNGMQWDRGYDEQTRDMQRDDDQGEEAQS